MTTSNVIAHIATSSPPPRGPLPVSEATLQAIRSIPLLEVAGAVTLHKDLATTGIERVGATVPGQHQVRRVRSAVEVPDLHAVRRGDLIVRVGRRRGEA